MTDEKQMTAAEYALGTLPGDRRAEISRAMESDPALRDAVAAWETRLAPLATDLGDQTLPASLFSEIEAQIDQIEAPPPNFTLRAQAGEWEEFSEGIQKRELWRNPPHNRVSMLLRVQPGARYFAHTHDTDEECYVVEGEISFGDLTLNTGDFHLARAGSVHPAAFSKNGCLLMLTTGIE